MSDSLTGTVVVIQPAIQIIEVGTGAVGPRGLFGEDEMVYAERVDFVSSTLIYRGQAVPGELESASTWRVRRLTIGAGGDVTSEWADGDAQFDNVWADRTTKTYV